MQTSSLARIEITPFAVIAGEIVQERKTGQLTIVRASRRRTLYWSQGELVLATSDSPEESLGDFLVRRGAIPADKALLVMAEDEPTATAARFHELGVLDLSHRQTLLREWMASLFIPLFSLDEGTAAFTEAQALEPEKRVFLQSTAALLLEGIRTITNGLVLRRSLGDIKRLIAPSRQSRFSLDSVALTEPERRIATALTQPQTIEAFLKQWSSESIVAARVVIGMLALGVFAEVDERAQTHALSSIDDMQRDLELLAAIGSSDQRSLRAVALSRQLGMLDHYQLLNVPRAATRAQLITAADDKKKQYDPATYPPIVREPLQAIIRRIDEAVLTLKEPVRRAAYDKLLQSSGGPRDEASMQQRISRQQIAEQNYARARELTVDGDYYGAIVLLKQAVEYAPENAQAWFLLGTCQERNPKWRRDAAESFQQALSVDPYFVDALIALGDVYKSEAMISRAQACWEDALKIVPDNQQAKTRLAALKKQR
jgi:curved DNA-binding protein CbpA